MPDDSGPPHIEIVDAELTNRPSVLLQVIFHRWVLRPAWGLLLFVLAFALVLRLELALVNPVLLHQGSPDTLNPHDILVPLLTLIAALVATLLPSFFEQLRALSYGFRGKPWIRFTVGLLTGGILAAGACAGLRMANVLVPIAPRAPWHAILRQGAVWGSIFLMFALLEELLTRSYVQYTLTRGLAYLYRRFLGLRTGIGAAFWTTAILTSMLFAWLYKENPGQTDKGLAGLFALGMLYCWSLWRTGNLWWALGFHAAWDFTQGFIFMMPDGGLPIRDHMYYWVAQGSPLLSGGTAGLDGSILVYPIILVAVLSLLPFAPTRTYPELWRQASRQTPKVEHYETVPDPDRA